MAARLRHVKILVCIKNHCKFFSQKKFCFQFKHLVTWNIFFKTKKMFVVIFLNIAKFLHGTNGDPYTCGRLSTELYFFREN